MSQVPEESQQTDTDLIKQLRKRLEIAHLRVEIIKAEDEAGAKAKAEVEAKAKAALESTDAQRLPWASQPVNNLLSQPCPESAPASAVVRQERQAIEAAPKTAPSFSAGPLHVVVRADFREQCMATYLLMTQKNAPHQLLEEPAEGSLIRIPPQWTSLRRDAQCEVGAQRSTATVNEDRTLAAVRAGPALLPNMLFKADRNGQEQHQLNDASSAGFASKNDDGHHVAFRAYFQWKNGNMRLSDPAADYVREAGQARDELLGLEKAEYFMQLFGDHICTSPGLYGQKGSSSLQFQACAQSTSKDNAEAGSRAYGGSVGHASFGGGTLDLRSTSTNRDYEASNLSDSSAWRLEEGMGTPEEVVFLRYRDDHLAPSHLLPVWKLLRILSASKPDDEAKLLTAAAERSRAVWYLRLIQRLEQRQDFKGQRIWSLLVEMIRRWRTATGVRDAAAAAGQQLTTTGVLDTAAAGQQLTTSGVPDATAATQQLTTTGVLDAAAAGQWLAGVVLPPPKNSAAELSPEQLVFLEQMLEEHWRSNDPQETWDSVDAEAKKLMVEHALLEGRKGNHALCTALLNCEDGKKLLLSRPDLNDEIKKLKADRARVNLQDKVDYLLIDRVVQSSKNRAEKEIRAGQLAAEEALQKFESRAERAIEAGKCVALEALRASHLRAEEERRMRKEARADDNFLEGQQWAKEVVKAAKHKANEELLTGKGEAHEIVRISKERADEELMLVHKRVEEALLASKLRAQHELGSYESSVGDNLAARERHLQRLIDERGAVMTSEVQSTEQRLLQSLGGKVGW